MNKDRRTKLRNILSQLTEIQKLIESVKLEEELALDGMPENLQGSDRANQMEDNLDEFDNAIGYLDDALESLRCID